MLACGRAQGRGMARGRACDRSRSRDRGQGRSHAGPNTAEVSWKSYDDPDVGNALPPFRPNRPVAVHFDQVVLRNTMTTASEFFHLFFSVEMLTSICTHTNSYAFQHIAAGTHTSYTNADGTWQETTPEGVR